MPVLGRVLANGPRHPAERICSACRCNRDSALTDCIHHQSVKCPADAAPASLSADMGNSSSKDTQNAARGQSHRHLNGSAQSASSSAGVQQAAAEHIITQIYGPTNGGSRRGSRHDLSFLHIGRDRNAEQQANERPRETRQEKEARRTERERQARLKERELSIREESVDGGYLVTLGTYTGPEDFSKPVVRQLQVRCPIYFDELFGLTRYRLSAGSRLSGRASMTIRIRGPSINWSPPSGDSRFPRLMRFLPSSRVLPLRISVVPRHSTETAVALLYPFRRGRYRTTPTAPPPCHPHIPQRPQIRDHRLHLGHHRCSVAGQRLWHRLPRDPRVPRPI